GRHGAVVSLALLDLQRIPLTGLPGPLVARRPHELVTDPECVMVCPLVRGARELVGAQRIVTEDREEGFDRAQIANELITIRHSRSRRLSAFDSGACGASLQCDLRNPAQVQSVCMQRVGNVKWAPMVWSQTAQRGSRYGLLTPDLT